MTGVAEAFVVQSIAPAELVFGVLAVLVCALVFFIVLRVLTALLGSLGCLVSRLVRRGGCSSGPPAAGRGPLSSRVCPNARCRKVNDRSAQFCAQCGSRI